MDKMIMNWLRKIMIGRYGVDPLNKFLLITSLIAMLISNIFGGAILYTIALLVLAYTYFRMLSKNHYKRHQENNRYLYNKNKVLNVFQKARIRLIKERYTIYTSVQAVNKKYVFQEEKVGYKLPVPNAIHSLLRRAKLCKFVVCCIHFLYKVCII